MSSTIEFSGYTWEVRDEESCDPGPNKWSSRNVWIDTNGFLHLIIKKINNVWSCAEVISTQTFGYGTYQWQIEGRVDQLDKNVVLGLFNYKDGDDKHHEIDIEFARWGDASLPNYNYTVYPASGSGDAGKLEIEYELELNGTYTTHLFKRTSSSVSIKGFDGFTTNEDNMFFAWNTPPGYDVSTLSLPVHMNLWLFGGRGPSDGDEVEIVVHSFKYMEN